MNTVFDVRAVARHRPTLIALVAALAVAFFPGTGSGDEQSGDVAVTMQPTEVGSAQDAGGAVATGAGQSDGEAGGTAGLSAGPGAAVGPGGDGQASAPSAPTGAGVNSAAALAAPDCDPAAKRLKVSYVFGPPCVVAWPAGADNGGATSMGVTGESIKVVVIARGDDAVKQTWAEHAEVFARSYRTWGRKVEIVFVESSGTSEVQQRADAIKIANLKPFAVISTPTGSPGRVFKQELASRGVLMGDPTNVAGDMLTKAPFLWSLSSGDDRMNEANAAEWIGRKLVGKPARWSGSAVTQTQPRRFGLILPDNWDRGEFERTFARYGGTIAVWETHDNQIGAIPSYQERARTIAAKFKDAGVNSVINFASVFFDIVLTKEATSQQWFPEWVLSGWGGSDIELFARLMDPAQWKSAFGLSMFPIGGDPLGPHESFHAWYWGGRNAKAADPSIMWELHWLFGGVHGAGPRLTPHAFRDGLFAAPPRGGAANGAVMSYQASFGRWGVVPWDDYSFMEDFAEVWWDPAARGKDNLVKAEGAGKYRFVDGGRRQIPGRWADGEPKMFDPAGTALWMTAYPPNDRPPDYPCQGCPSTS